MEMLVIETNGHEIGVIKFHGPKTCEAPGLQFSLEMIEFFQGGCKSFFSTGQLVLVAYGRIIKVFQLLQQGDQEGAK